MVATGRYESHLSEKVKCMRDAAAATGAGEISSAGRTSLWCGLSVLCIINNQATEVFVYMHNLLFFCLEMSSLKLEAIGSGKIHSAMDPISFIKHADVSRFYTQRSL